MKRTRMILILALAVLMASMLACKTAEPAVTEPDVAEAAAVTEEPTEEPTAEPTEEPTAEPTEEPTAEPTEEPSALQRGVWTDNVYDNEYLNLHFTMPEGYIAATDAEIAAMMELGVETLENDNIDDYQKATATLTTIYDMMVTNPATGSNVLLILENLRLVIGGVNITPEEYAAILSEQLAETEVSGYKYTVQEGYTAELGGESFYVLPTMLGDGLMSQDYYLRRVDGYMLAVCITCAGADEADKAMMTEAFSVVGA